MGARSQTILVALLLASAAPRAWAQATAPDYQDGEWHLEREPAQELSATLEGEVRAPDLSAEEWILYAAQAPKHALSEARRQTFATKGSGKARRSKPVDGVLLLRGARLPAEEKGIRYRLEYAITTYTVTLRPGASKTRVRAPSFRLLRPYLEAKGPFEFSDPRVAAWVRRTGLKRRRGERDLAFGWRVLDAIAKGFTYAAPPKSPERTCAQVIADGASDCGGLSGVAVSVLRANKIPARWVVGRWVVPDKDDEPQYHVKFEFYAKGIGWVPCDGSGAVTWKGKAAAAFGRARGTFFVMHVESPLEVKSFHWGLKQVLFMQGAVWWVKGRGSLDGNVSSERWIVREKR
jgi:transglutaminase-like putative cysteine protease